jgi:MFS family permease
VLRGVALWLRPVGWPPLPDGARRRTRRLSCFAIGTQAIFIGGWVLAGALEDHYSLLRQYISELGRSGAAHPWIFSISVAVWGLGFIALAVALAPALRARPWAKAMPLLFVLAGACAIVVAPVRMDCSPTLSHLCRSRETAGALSWHHYTHGWASLGINAFLLLTPFAIARSAWPSRLARLTSSGGLVVLIAWAVTFFALHDHIAQPHDLQAATAATSVNPSRPLPRLTRATAAGQDPRTSQ